MSKSKETAVAVATDQVPSTYDYGEYGRAGFEEMKSSDLSLPFISLLQPMSPQVDAEQGIHPGMLFNTVTGQAISGKEGITFIACHKEVNFIEFVKRENGGGFIAAHPEGSPVIADAIKLNKGKRAAKYTLANDHELIETHSVYGLILNAEGSEVEGFAVITFTSTKIKPCRNWMTALYTIKGRPPIFAARSVIKTEKQQNDKGTFFNYKIEPLRGDWVKSLLNPVTEKHLLQEALTFREAITSGAAKASYEQTQDDYAATSTASKTVDDSDEDAPF